VYSLLVEFYWLIKKHRISNQSIHSLFKKDTENHQHGPTQLPCISMLAIMAMFKSNIFGPRGSLGDLETGKIKSFIRSCYGERPLKYGTDEPSLS
jgi:hypothetical protein